MEWITATISSLVPSTHRTHNDERESNFFLFPVYSRRIQWRLDANPLFVPIAVPDAAIVSIIFDSSTTPLW